MRSEKGEEGNVVVEGIGEGGVGLVASAGERGEAFLEVEDDAVLLLKLVAEARGVRFESRDTGGDGHGGYLASEIELLVGVGWDDGENLVGEVEIHRIAQ